MGAGDVAVDQVGRQGGAQGRPRRRDARVRARGLPRQAPQAAHASRHRQGCRRRPAPGVRAMEVRCEARRGRDIRARSRDTRGRGQRRHQSPHRRPHTSRRVHRTRQGDREGHRGNLGALRQIGPNDASKADVEGAPVDRGERQFGFGIG